MKKILTALLATVFVFSLCATGLSAAVINWDLSDDGDLDIDTDTNTDSYYVTQSDSVTDNRIYVYGDSSVDITIEDLNIDVDGRDVSPIEIYDDATLNLTVKGNNTMDSYGSDYAGIWMSDGTTLNIDGDGTLTVYGDDASAAIGSDYEDDFDADLTIGGDVTVNAYSEYDGAGIGSGNDGDFLGSVTIKDNANVYAYSGSCGAGIGSGDFGEVSGSITIQDDATVKAVSVYSAGIGAGDEGWISEDGSITIRDRANVTAIGDERDEGEGFDDEKQALGANFCDMDGSISILGNANVTVNGLIGGTDAYDDGNDGTILVESSATINGESATEIIDELADEGLEVEKVEVEVEVEQKPVAAHSDAFWQYWRTAAAQIRQQKTVTLTVPENLDTSVLPTFLFTAIKDVNANVTLNLNGKTYNLNANNLPAYYSWASEVSASVLG